MLRLLKSVFSVIWVRTWVQVVYRQKNRPPIGRPDRSANQRPIFFVGKPLELSTHVLSFISEKSDFSWIIEDSWRKLLLPLTEIFFISWIEERPFSTVKMAKARALYLLNCIGHQSCQAVGIFVKGSMKDYGHPDP